MRSEKANLNSFLKLSHFFGNDLLFVQAGGGNVSTKTGKNEMYIKASGARLQELSMGKGWTRANVSAICQGVTSLGKQRSAVKREVGYAKLIGTSAKATGPRASMESGFHAAINRRHVVHVHSVAGLLLAIKSKSEIKGHLFKWLGQKVSVRVLEPSLPGLDLTLRVMESTQHENNGEVDLWVLKNHGLIWAADDEKKLIDASKRFESVLRRKFSLNKYKFPHLAGSSRCRESRAATVVGWKIYCFCHWPSCRLNMTAFFPDFLIYFSNLSGALTGLKINSPCQVSVRAENVNSARDRIEVFYAHALFTTLAGPNAKPLPSAILRTLRGLETEKLRLKQASNS